MEQINEILGMELFELSGTQVTLGTLAVVLLIVAGTYLLSLVLRKTLLRVFRSDDPQAQGALRALARLLHYLIMLVGTGVALDTLGVDLMALLATGALFAVGIGFALQNIVQNFVSGIILLFERSIKPNDILEVEGCIVRVVQMGIRATVARTLDDEEIIIPNNTLVQNAVKNYTLADSLYRLRATVGVVYGSDMARVREVLHGVGEAIAWRSKARAPVVLLTEFGDSSVNFELSVWIDDPWLVRQRRSAVNDAIWWALKEAGIVIAFPQLDVHFDPPLERSLKAVSGAR